MQMTNTELAALVNSRLGLGGPDSVTANVVRQWVDWDVLPKARIQGREKDRGPVWSRSDAAIRRALRLAGLRRQGMRREKALIVQAYIEWGHPDFDRVRDALLDEWSKWIAQLTRRQTTFLDKTEFRDVSATKKRAIATQLGPLDPRFVGTQFQHSPELYAAIGEFARNGNGSAKDIEALICGAFGQMLPGIAEILPPHFIGGLAGAIAGLIGASDEITNSGERTIQTASERQFRIARHQIRFFYRLLSRVGQQGETASLDPNAGHLLQTLRSLAPQISIGPWLIISFVQVLRAFGPK